jgi:hypothetical protein
MIVFADDKAPPGSYYAKLAESLTYMSEWYIRWNHIGNGIFKRKESKTSEVTTHNLCEAQKELDELETLIIGKAGILAYYRQEERRA